MFYYLMILLLLQLELSFTLPTQQYLYLSVHWVIGLPAESQAAACLRNGLLVGNLIEVLKDDNDKQVNWSESTFNGITNGFGYQALGLTGCCSATMFCDSANQVCYPFSLQDSYYENINVSILPQDSLFSPVYTCHSPSTLPSDNIFNQIAVTRVSPNISQSLQYIRIDGSNYNTSRLDVNVVDITIHGKTCDDVNICSPICKPCNETVPCYGTDVCLNISPNFMPSFCAPACSTTKPCMCSGVGGNGASSQCYNVPALNQSIVSACLPYPYNPTMCSSPSNQQSDILTDNRSLSCRVPSFISTINDTAIISINGVFGNQANNGNNQLSIYVDKCTLDLQCDDSDICTIDTCSNGVCTFTSSSICSKMPARYNKVSIGEMKFPQIQNKSAINYTLDALDVDSNGIMLSNATFYDDWPPAEIDLPFPITFYGVTRDKIYVSPNGAVFFDFIAPCGSSFASPGYCDLSNYHGIIGPYLTDLDPTAYASDQASNYALHNSTILFWKSTDNSKVTIIWKDIYFFTFTPKSSDHLLTFALQLSNDSVATFYYYDMISPLPLLQLWMAGAKSISSGPSVQSISIPPNYLVSGNVVSLCDLSNNIACMSPSCGPTNTTVSISIPKLTCGPGLPIASYSCAFGNILVPALFISNSSYAFDTIECISPPVSNVSSLLFPSTVVIKIFVVINNSFENIPIELNLVGQTQFGHELYTNALVYQYNNLFSCSCYPDNSVVGRVCDVNNVCRNTSITNIDCAGVVDGSASFDDCLVCSGGNTTIVPNSSKNCRGVCFASNYGCPSTGPVTSPPTIYPSTQQPTNKPKTTAGPTLVYLDQITQSSEINLLIVVFFATSFILFCMFTFCINCLRKVINSRALFHDVERDFSFLQGGQNNTRPLEPQGIQVQDLAKLPISSADEKVVMGDCCCICLLNFELNDQVRILPCQHTFHSDCVASWFKMSVLCPLCKDDVRSPTNRRKRKDSNPLLRNNNINNNNISTKSPPESPNNKMSNPLILRSDDESEEGEDSAFVKIEVEMVEWERGKKDVKKDEGII